MANKHNLPPQKVIDALISIVNDGTKLLTPDLNSEIAEKWIDYSQKMVEVITKDVEVAIHFNYLRLIMKLAGNRYATPKEKVYSCLDYLLKVAEILTLDGGNNA